MADESNSTTTAEVPETTVESSEAANPAAEPKKTETDAAEHMIPKSRFDEVNRRLRELEREREAQAKAAQEAEQKRLAEEGKYKELYERQQAEIAKAQAEAKAATLRMLRREVADRVKLPLELADRLQGETEEELLADAKILLAAIPKPQAPNTNAASGNGAVPLPGKLSDQERAEKAARYGVKPEYYNA